MLPYHLLNEKKNQVKIAKRVGFLSGFLLEKNHLNRKKFSQHVIIINSHKTLSYLIQMGI
jgi:hypothetical protein